MSVLDDIALVVEALERLLALAEKLDPNFANNSVVSDLQKALSVLKSLNL